MLRALALWALVLALPVAAQEPTRLIVRFKDDVTKASTGKSRIEKLADPGGARLTHLRAMAPMSFA